MYFFFSLGLCFLIASIFKFVMRKKSNRQYYNTQWIEDDLVLNIEKKLSNYKPEKRASMTSKELDTYFSSLVAPLNQQIVDEELDDVDMVV